MGNSSGKATAALSRSKIVGETMAKKVKKNVQREAQQFMASERAEKVLDKQKEIPRRAPMNLGGAQLSDEIKHKRMREIEAQQQPDEKFLSSMKDIFLSSTDPVVTSPRNSDVHADERSDDLKSKLPQKLPSAMLKQADTPRGRADLKTVIDAMYNHKMNPQDWGPAEVAERINIRESDAKDILDNFALLDGTSIFKDSTNANEKEQPLSPLKPM